jgi:hypothetical protein
VDVQCGFDASRHADVKHRSAKLARDAGSAVAVSELTSSEDCARLYSWVKRPAKLSYTLANRHSHKPGTAGQRSRKDYSQLCERIQTGFHDHAHHSQQPLSQLAHLEVMPPARLLQLLLHLQRRVSSVHKLYGDLHSSEQVRRHCNVVCNMCELEWRISRQWGSNAVAQAERHAAKHCAWRRTVGATVRYCLRRRCCTNASALRGAPLRRCARQRHRRLAPRNRSQRPRALPSSLMLLVKSTQWLASPQDSQTLPQAKSGCHLRQRHYPGRHTTQCECSATIAPATEVHWLLTNVHRVRQHVHSR